MQKNENQTIVAESENNPKTWLKSEAIKSISKMLSASMNRRTASALLAGRMSQREKRRVFSRLLKNDAMFKRKEGDEKFHQLDEKELAVVVDRNGQYYKEGKFITLDPAQHEDLYSNYLIFRARLWAGVETPPDEFRRALYDVNELLLEAAIDVYGFDTENTVVVFLWRAGLSFVRPAALKKFKYFINVDVSRNEETLEAVIKYFSEFKGDAKKMKFLIVDPMLATAGSVVAVIKRLKEMGARNKNICIASVFAAPEGIARILYNYRGVKLVIGVVDEYLDKQGYIQPGFGDCGDRFVEDLDAKEEVEEYDRIGIFNTPNERVLLESKKGYKVAA